MLTIIPKIISENAESCETVFEAIENNSLIGHLKASLTPETLNITAISFDCDDIFILDGLCRSAFSFAVNKGVRNARFSLINADLLKLGYNDEMDIKSFFDKNCKNSL